MSGVQRLLRALLPRGLYARMEAESREWIARCPDCGLERSIWEIGGVRYGARGEPKRLMECPRCARGTWHRLERRPQAPGTP